MGVPAVLLAAVVGLLRGAVVYDVRAFGAKGDGVTDDGKAIAAAFAACRGGGTGGEVLFPAPFVFLSGPWELGCNDTVVTVRGLPVQPPLIVDPLIIDLIPPRSPTQLECAMSWPVLSRMPHGAPECTPAALQ